MTTPEENETVLKNEGDSQVSSAERKLRNQGRPDGLFRACMDQIRRAHSIGQALRGAVLVSGLLTDKFCYAELLLQFYVPTKALEERMAYVCEGKSKNDFPLISKLRNKLHYNFQIGYERDLEYLLGKDDWKDLVRKWTTESAKKYVEDINCANDSELVAGLFILWGPLIVGGGPALKSRVGKAFGEEATHVFEDVTGKGKRQRRDDFIEAIDSLFDDLDANGFKKDSFSDIVSCSGKFMNYNNRMMMSVKKQPWWFSRAKIIIFSLCVPMMLAYGLNSYRRSLPEKAS